MVHRCQGRVVLTMRGTHLNGWSRPPTDCEERSFLDDFRQTICRRDWDWLSGLAHDRRGHTVAVPSQLSKFPTIFPEPADRKNNEQPPSTSNRGSRAELDVVAPVNADTILRAIPQIPAFASDRSPIAAVQVRPLEPIAKLHCRALVAFTLDDVRGVRIVAHSFLLCSQTITVVGQLLLELYGRANSNIKIEMEPPLNLTLAIARSVPGEFDAGYFHHCVRRTLICNVQRSLYQRSFCKTAAARGARPRSPPAT